jgi:integrase
MTPYGDGRVYLRGRRYWIAYYAPVRGRNEQVREPGGATEAEARKLLARRLADVRLHREGRSQYAGPAAAKMTVKRVVEAYLDDAETRGLRSLRASSSHAKAVIEEIGSTRLTLLSSDTVSRYIKTRRKKGRAVATINRELEILRAACALAKKDGRITWEPNIRTLGNRDAGVRTGFLSREEMSLLIDSIPDDDLRDFVAFFALTAMRPGEIASLRWSALDEKAGVLCLEPAGAKTGDPRVLPLVEEIAAVIARRKAKRMRSPLIFHNGGKPATRRSGGFSKGWYGAWARALEVAGLPASTLVYDLRRSAIRALREAGVDERTIMAISGHRTRRTFDRYAIVTTSDMATALRSVAGYAAHERGQNKHKRGGKAQ